MLSMSESRGYRCAALARREERVITMLNAAIEKYAYSKELYQAWWQAQRERKPLDGQAVKQALLDANGKPKPEAQQLEYLRYQIEMRVIALGWTQYATRWSTQPDCRIGTVAHLQELLVAEILVHEQEQARRKLLPTEAAPPHTGAIDLGQLGTRDENSLQISRRALFSKEELSRKADAEMQRRIEAGVQDNVEILQPAR